MENYAKSDITNDTSKKAYMGVFTRPAKEIAKSLLRPSAPFVDHDLLKDSDTFSRVIGEISQQESEKTQDDILQSV